MPLGDELVAPEPGDNGFVVEELPRVIPSGTNNEPDVEPMTTCVMVTLPVRVLVPEGPATVPVPVTAFLLLPELV